MRYGFTTGSCAAAAAGAASRMLFGGKEINDISIMTPAGIVYHAQIEDIRGNSCAVRKFSGDDPDITNGTLIYASVRLISDGKGEVYIKGGEGVGRVTRPGLDQPVGEWAINSVPRQMIKDVVGETMEMYGVQDSVEVTISVPEGEELAKKTFNPRLGIEGGISIIGTSGIVEPMSTRALLDTIKVELKQQKEEGAEVAVVSPGNYGLDFMKEHYGYDLDKAVKCSNYIGDTIDMVKELGFKKMQLCGHIGKLIKVSGGIMNTHSKEADCRMELMSAAALKAGADTQTALAVLDMLTTDEALDYLFDKGFGEKSMAYITERIDYYLKKRAGEELDIRCIVFSNARGLLGETAVPFIS
ncbi:MAG: cobalamin biosynthesis protein CbiD [Lachnospiraceae bacterium]|nr:cobalamin biosynthesis protein CbiD [Lachnospiraceae bacterium]